MYNVIIIYTQIAEDAERILKYADQILRYNWNLYGFQRLGSGCEVVTTDGFGNPCHGERELKLFGIAIKVPETMSYRTAMTYLEYGNRRVNCYAEYHYAVL